MAAYRQPGGTGPARDSTELAGDAPGLRLHAAEDGYVLLRGAVPAPTVAATAGALEAVLRRAGLFPPEPGTWADVHGDRELFRRLYSVEELHALQHEPGLVALAAALLEVEPADVLVHPHPALRAVFPATPLPIGATPPHQDHLGMQGTTDAYTIWVALSPCPREAGVLAVAEGSHRGGLRPYRPAPGARVACCEAGDLDGRWVAADLEPGDVVAFHSLTVHRALPNTSAALRLSVDSRYQRAADPVCRSALRELHDLPWDELYSGWGDRSRHLRRYWERLPLQVSEFDATLLS